MQDVAQRMLQPLDDAHTLGVTNHRGAVGPGDPHQGRIRGLPQQRGVQLELAHEIGLEHRLLGRREQNQRQQIDGPCACCVIDVRHDPLRQLVHRRRQPRRALFSECGRAVRRMRSQQIVQADGLAEADVHLAEILP